MTDIKDFLLAVVAAVAGVYVMEWLGYVVRGTPSAITGGAGGAGSRARGAGARARNSYPTPPAANVPAPKIARTANNVGPTEPTSFAYAKGIGGRSFVL